MGVTIMKRGLWVPDEIAARPWGPSDLGVLIRKCAKLLPAEMAAELIEAASRVVVLESQLSVRVLRACTEHGTWACPCATPVEDYGVVSRKVITDAGVAFLVDAWQNIVELENMKFHGLGTSSAAEAVGQTALGTELTTQYDPDNTRATGTLAEGATGNIFKSEGTNTVDAGVTVEEHGLLSQAAVGGGVLWDRSLTGSKALSAAEGLSSTYEMTATSGG